MVKGRSGGTILRLAGLGDQTFHSPARDMRVRNGDVASDFGLLLGLSPFPYPGGGSAQLGMNLKKFSQNGIKILFQNCWVKYLFLHESNFHVRGYDHN